MESLLFKKKERKRLNFSLLLACLTDKYALLADHVDVLHTLEIMCVAILLSECIRGNGEHIWWLKRHVHNRQMWIYRLTHTHARTHVQTDTSYRNSFEMNAFNGTTAHLERTENVMRFIHIWIGWENKQTIARIHKIWDLFHFHALICIGENLFCYPNKLIISEEIQLESEEKSIKLECDINSNRNQSSWGIMYERNFRMETEEIETQLN